MILVAAGTVLMVVTLAACVVYGETVRLASVDLRHLSTYLASTVRQNLPLGLSLEAYARELTGPLAVRRKRVLDGVAALVDEGSALSDAMDAQPEAFPAHYRALVRAGERGGNLARVLARFVGSLEDDRDPQTQMAVAIPVMELASVVVAFNTFFIVVLPKFLDMASETGTSGEGLLTARAVARWAALLLAFLLVVVFGGMPVPGLGGRIKRRLPALARLSSIVRWRMPLFSRYERRRAVARYALAAGELVDAGVPTAEALAIAAGVSGNACFDRIARDAAERVAEGSRLSDALKAGDAGGELPGDFVWYVEAGEASGNLAGALRSASESAAVRSRTALARLVGLVFPAAIVAAGLVVGSICYAVFAWLNDIAASLLL